MSIEFSTDWLSSRPVFYNTGTGAISHNINDVIDFRNFDFHPEGLNNYLEYGYSVFGQTPVKDVCFLPHDSVIRRDADGVLAITQTADPVLSWSRQICDEQDVLELIQEKVQQWEKTTAGKIIVPLSGGYDSRLLFSFLTDHSRARCFTYGLSKKQDQSYDVVYSRAVAEIFGSEWRHIELGEYHNYFKEWDDIFGVSVHAHGMYHVEFFKNILASFPLKGAGLLSGIYGDLWSGNVPFQKLRSPEDLIKIGYTHGISIYKSHFVLKSGNELRDNFWDNNCGNINDSFFQMVLLSRTKMILLNYLLALPASFGLSPWSPFLDQEVALRMLSIAPSRRQGRQWQVDYFKKAGLLVEERAPSCTRSQYLNHRAMHSVPLAPLQAGLLREIVKPSFVEWVNNKVSHLSLYDRLVTGLANMPINHLGGALRTLGFDKRLSAYYSYLILKPLEQLMEKRNHA